MAEEKKEILSGNESALNPKGDLPPMVPKEVKTASPYEEMGVAGVKVSNGFVHDEFLYQLNGESGRRIYREMRDNDAVISALIFVIEMLLRAVPWTISSDEKGEQAEEAIEFVESVFFKDMDHTFDDFIGNILTMLTYGWQYTEMVFKRRIGPEEEDKTRRSIYTDGKIGIRKLADRSQQTLHRWELDDNGEVLGMWQMPPVGGKSLIFIPIEKALHFRPHQHKGSPEGRSILRGAYRSWFFLKNIQEIEAIAIERELNGLPVGYIPNAILNGTSAEAIAARQKYESMVRDIKLNEQAGVLLPSDPYYDSEGNPTTMRQVEFKLLSAEGSRSIDTNMVALRYQMDMARTVLADFMMLGATDRGSYALAEEKTRIFLRTLEGWLESISTIINRKAIPALWRLNGLDLTYMPKLIPGTVKPKDLKVLSEFISQLARAGAPLFPDDALENHIRNIAGLPEKTPEDEFTIEGTETKPPAVPGITEE